jgi:hypothetical protein
MNNEIPEILNRAISTPITVSFTNSNEAKLWVFRAHNFKRRKAPHFAQLMISRKGPHVTIRVPQFTITETQP